ncbi:cornifin-A [Corvus moneduloides]|uniref:cornifin-A n=1 Tax=Corvus moneduloides TaxID=1196302 RepID=UPI001362C871|nr:cornifin-A [Corvus moneduloides]XP_031985072.1 cornifin-A [Corvus moneduloides]XP_031985073.1 cornifin-A [Corvus moneduloides]XP_031985074.1 cornifin-A [Corvus moneduloides]
MPLIPPGNRWRLQAGCSGPQDTLSLFCRGSLLLFVLLLDLLLQEKPLRAAAADTRQGCSFHEENPGSWDVGAANEGTGEGTGASRALPMRKGRGDTEGAPTAACSQGRARFCLLSKPNTVCAFLVCLFIFHAKGIPHNGFPRKKMRDFFLAFLEAVNHLAPFCGVPAARGATRCDIRARAVPPPGGSGRCIPASLRPCIPASLRPGIPASLRPCIPASLRPCIPASLHPGIPASLHSYVPAFLHPCVPASLRPCIPASLHPCVPASLHPGIPASRHPCIPASLRLCVPASLRPCVPASLRPCIPASLRPCIPTSLHSCIPASLRPCIPASLSPCIPAQNQPSAGLPRQDFLVLPPS